MALVKMEAGATLDMLTSGEVRNELARFGEEMSNRPPTLVTASCSATVDSGGDLGSGDPFGAGEVVYTAPLGFVAVLHRLSIMAPGSVGSTGATPWPADDEAAWLNWYSGPPAARRLIGFLPNGGPVLPAVVTEGGHEAARIRGGDDLQLVGANLPAGTLTVNLQVRLWEVAK